MKTQAGSDPKRPNGGRPRLGSIQEEIERLKQNNLYRELRVLQKKNALEASFQNHPLTLFCGNDYLGLSHHPRLIRAAQQALESEGVGSGASRLISGTSEIHEKLEKRTALFKNKESALVYTAGYLANLGVLSALAGQDDVIVMDKLCHASLIDGAKLSGATLRVFPHKNYERCEELLAQCHDKKIFLVSDTVFSMDGDRADIQKLIQLKEKYQAFLILDDAHGTGVMGKKGRGATEGFEDQIDVITGTFSKALGAIGGFAAMSSEIRQYLINKSRSFIFATSLPPAMAAAALEAVQILEATPSLRESLWKNVQKMRAALQEMGVPVPEELSPILPLLVGPEKEAMDLSASLLKAGFLVPAIRTPTVGKGKARLRITLSASHSTASINAFLNALKATGFRNLLK